ncbi:MAG: hypothetical protein K2K57_13560 [Oscillospiraceae bacterium]|nr:hypothetical protein [Oscillospiraceae bacterium]
MKRTKLLKFITGILVSCTVMLCGTSVCADIIMEPYGENSDFYAKHYSECEIENNVRGYSALTDFDIYLSPLDDQAVRYVQKGDVLRSNTFYTDSEGVRWAYDYNWDDTGKTGWYKTENVELVYDYISFEEEHKNELTDYKGQLNDYVPEKQVVLWTYPGSGEIRSIRTPKNWFPEGYVFTIENTAEYTYVDESETEWVFLGYGFNSWVDLSDIEGEAAAAVSATVTSISETSTSAEIVSSETVSSETALSDSSTYSEKADAAETQRDEMIYVTTEAMEEASEMVLAISNIPEPPTSDENEKPNFLLPIVLALCAAAAAGGFLVGTKRKKP